MAFSLYKEENEYTVFASNRKKLWNEPFDLGSPHGNPRSPLLCHPCYRLWPAEPLTWQDLIWGLPPTVFVCHVIRSANLRACCILDFFLWHFYKHHRFLYEGALKSLRLRLVKSPESVCTLPLRSLEKWKWWLHSVLSWPLSSGRPGWPAGWISLVLDFSQLFAVGLTVDSMRHSRVWALESDRTRKPGFAMCRYDLGKMLSLRPRVSHPVVSVALVTWGCGDGRR